MISKRWIAVIVTAVFLAACTAAYESHELYESYEIYEPAPQAQSNALEMDKFMLQYIGADVETLTRTFGEPVFRGNVNDGLGLVFSFQNTDVQFLFSWVEFGDEFRHDIGLEDLENHHRPRSVVMLLQHLFGNSGEPNFEPSLAELNEFFGETQTIRYDPQGNALYDWFAIYNYDDFVFMFGFDSNDEFARSFGVQIWRQN